MTGASCAQEVQGQTKHDLAHDITDCLLYVRVGCGWPVCSTECAGLKFEHFRLECPLFKEKKADVRASEFRYGDVEPLYDVVSPVRVLLSDVVDREVFFGQESHLERWKGDDGGGEWVASHKDAVDYMREQLGFTDEEEVRFWTVHTAHNQL